MAIAEHIAQAADGNYEELLLTHADCLEDIELLKEEIRRLREEQEAEVEAQNERDE